MLCERSITINTQPLNRRKIGSVVSSLVIGGALAWATPCDAQIVVPAVASKTGKAAAMYADTSRQQAWLNATIDQRAKLAEQLGDDGARVFAKAKGWSPVFDGTARRIAQGPDQVYRAGDGVVHVIEAKGGSGQLGRAYGYAQGSSEWAVESAKRVLRNPAVSKAERRGAGLVLEAGAKRKLQVHVVRTSHVLGEPSAAVLEQTVKSTDEAARLAASGLDGVGRGVSQAVDDVARATSTGGSVLRTTAKVAVPVAVVVDGGLRIRGGVETERQFRAGEISIHEREAAHARNVAGIAAGWGGALAGAKLGAAGGGAAGSAVAPGPGTAVGGIVGGVAGGVGGYIGGETAAEAAAEWAVNRVHTAGTTIAGTVEAAWDGTVKTANSAARSVNRAWNWVRGN